jgi:hypothetical protein
MTKAFGPWVKQLEAEVAALEIPASEADKPLAANEALLTKTLTKVEGLTTIDQLTKVLDDKTTTALFDVATLKQIKDPAALRAAMIARLEALRSKNPKWNAGELKIRKGLIKKLSTGAGVFGSEFKSSYNKTTKETHWYVAQEVNAPSVMQLLEIGFAAHDELAAAPTKPTDPKYYKQVFNREFIETMMRFGWAPLGSQEAFLDTMHFDFLEGWTGTVKGDFHAHGEIGPRDH